MGICRKNNNTEISFCLNFDTANFKIKGDWKSCDMMYWFPPPPRQRQGWRRGAWHCPPPGWRRGAWHCPPPGCRRGAWHCPPGSCCSLAVHNDSMHSQLNNYVYFYKTKKVCLHLIAIQKHQSAHCTIVPPCNLISVEKWAFNECTTDDYNHLDTLCIFLRFSNMFSISRRYLLVQTGNRSLRK